MIRVVDYFAGAGGFSTGAAIAGLEVVAAANHWSVAVESHAKNHPKVHHICQDLNLFDPGSLPEFDILTASPSCQGHTRARGTDKPRHDVSRATAWCVIDCAEIRRPKRIVVENVVEFTKWTLFPQWRYSLEALGYAVSINVINAKNFGVPQDRERAIIVCAHGERTAPRVVQPMLPERGAIEVIDFSSGKWFPTEKYVAATQVRIAHGRAQGWRRFVAPFYGSGSGQMARSLNRPLGTVTTIDRWLVVDGDRGRILTVDENREFMSFPCGYHLAGNRRDQIMQLGNAIPPLMAAEVLRQVAA